MATHMANSPAGFSICVEKIASVCSTEFLEVMSKLDTKLLAQCIPMANSKPSSNRVSIPKNRAKKI